MGWNDGHCVHEKGAKVDGGSGTSQQWRQPLYAPRVMVPIKPIVDFFGRDRHIPFKILKKLMMV